MTVDSRSIRSIGFDPVTNTLEVEFRESEAVYQYFMVPRAVHEALMNSISIGEFFNRSIKDHYAFRKTN